MIKLEAPATVHFYVKRYISCKGTDVTNKYLIGKNRTRAGETIIKSKSSIQVLNSNSQSSQ